MTFCGRLTINPARFQGQAEESDTLFLAPISGNSIPLVSANSVAHVTFLAGPSDAAQPYLLTGLVPCAEYDVWAVENSGVAVVGLAMWNPPQAFGAGAFGRGAFGKHPFPCLMDAAYLGLPTNPAPLALRLANGEMVTAQANCATNLGSIKLSDAGTIRCHKTYGLKREWGIWNAHNQKPIILKGGNTHVFNLSEIFAPTEYRPSWSPFFGDADAFLQIFSGREEAIDCRYHHALWIQTFTGKAAVVSGAIGFNRSGGFNTGSHQVIVLDIPPGLWFQRDIEGYGGPGYIAEASTQCARYVCQGSAGTKKMWGLVWTQDVVATDVCNDGSSYIEMWGQENRMLLTAEWLG